MKMGIDVAIVDENGQELEVLGDPRRLTSSLLPKGDVENSDFYCLRFIDPYGDTVFNRYQIPILIREIRQKLEEIDDPEAKQHAVAALALAERAVEHVHQYVKFIGD